MSNLLKQKKRVLLPTFIKACQALTYIWRGNNGHAILLRFSNGFGSAFGYRIERGSYGLL